jgi:hypothetical protein
LPVPRRRLWTCKLREAIEDGDAGAMTDQQIEAEIRILVAITRWQTTC